MNVGLIIVHRYVDFPLRNEQGLDRCDKVLTKVGDVDVDFTQHVVMVEHFNCLLTHG